MILQREIVLKQIVYSIVAVTLSAAAVAEEESEQKDAFPAITIEGLSMIDGFEQDAGRIYCTNEHPAPNPGSVFGPEDLPDHCMFMFDPVYRGKLPVPVPVTSPPSILKLDEPASAE